MPIKSGVTFVLSAAHRDLDTGNVHGHTWEITAWFAYGNDFRTNEAVHKRRLRDVLGPLDHTTLPDDLAWGESMACYVAAMLNAQVSMAPCVQVDVVRPSERIFATWTS